MKIKRFTDKDMRSVLRRVREEQGPDAVILSNRRVDDGIEVVTAVDYDEALVQHALGGGASADIAAPEERPEQIDRAVPDASADQLQPEVPVAESPVNEAPAEVVSAELQSGVADDETVTELEDVTELSAMRAEISSLRGLLETQLSDLVWRDRSSNSPQRAQVLRNLSRLGVAPDIASMVANRLGPLDDDKQVWREPLTSLAQLIPVVDDPLIAAGGVAALIGPTGVGKTTTIAKIAARYAMEHGSDGIALISADAYRIGAREHLMAFGNIIGVSVHSAASASELSELLERFRNKKLVLIDTEGTSQRDRALADRLAAYGENADRVHFYLTLSAATQESGIDETVRRFKTVPLSGAIVTKIDEAGQLGCVISALIRHDLPTAFVADGQRVPDDLHGAHCKRLWLVNQAVECIRLSKPQIDERTMADRFAHASAVNG